MNQIFIIILFLFISTPTLACTVPMSGPEFDKHIKIEKIAKNLNLFRVVVSKEVEGLKHGAYISVEYYKANSEFRSGEYSKVIRPEEKGANYVAIFKLAKIEGYVPYVEVFWPPEQCCLCGAYGYSDDIILE